MLSMGQRTADFLLHWRWQVIVVYLALTAFFAVGVVRIAHSFQAQTSVADLIPAHNRVTDVFERYQSFSKPATVEILLKVKQIGGAACHEGYRSCFFRKVEGDGLKVVGERIFDPKTVYKK